MSKQTKRKPRNPKPRIHGITASYQRLDNGDYVLFATNSQSFVNLLPREIAKDICKDLQTERWAQPKE